MFDSAVFDIVLSLVLYQYLIVYIRLDYYILFKMPLKSFIKIPLEYCIIESILNFAQTHNASLSSKLWHHKERVFLIQIC